MGVEAIRKEVRLKSRDAGIDGSFLRSQTPHRDPETFVCASSVGTRGGKPQRAEAIRRLVELLLKAKAK
jgi:hypothetical protein